MISEFQDSTRFDREARLGVGFGRIASGDEISEREGEGEPFSFSLEMVQ